MKILLKFCLTILMVMLCFFAYSQTESSNLGEGTGSSCDRWLGSCNTTDVISRQGNVVLGGGSASNVWKLQINSGGELPGSTDKGLHVNGNQVGIYTSGSTGIHSFGTTAGLFEGKVELLSGNLQVTQGNCSIHNGFLELGINGSIIERESNYLSINTGTFKLYDNGTFQSSFVNTSSLTANNIEADHMTINNKLETQRLDVLESLYSKRVEVVLPPFPPDYVFEESYDLMPLSDLRNYIDKNGHLPSIPSAKEMEEVGTLDIGEFQFKQLEKIEELVLYILELNEKLEKLEKNNQELTQKLNLLLDTDISPILKEVYLPPIFNQCR